MLLMQLVVIVQELLVLIKIQVLPTQVMVGMVDIAIIIVQLDKQVVQV